MRKIRRKTIALFFLFMAVQAIGQSDINKLNGIIKEYQGHKGYDYKEYPLGCFEEEYYSNEAKFAEGLIKELSLLDQKTFSNSEAINFELLRFVLQDKVDSYRFKMHLNPIQADQGFHLDLNYQIRPIRSYNDAIAYLNRLKAVPYFVKSHIKLIRKGIGEGLAQPEIIFKGYESSYNDHIVNDPESSYFYSPFNDLPDAIDSNRKDSLRTVARQIIKDSVVPGFEAVKNFFEKEYLPATRKKIGISSIKNGADFYQNRINYYTTTNEYTAKTIHEAGLKEVSRIKDEMQGIIKEIGFDGSFSDFLNFLRTDKQFYATTSGELLMHARDISKRIDAQLPSFFMILPRQPYGVKEVPAAMAPKYTTGRYSGSPINSTRPGYFLVNTYKLSSRPLYALPALAAHEGVPGHHLQIALNAELGDSIPGFRRNLYLSAYGEGWGLYSEHLADEMGIYETPYEKFGQLTYEMWRACRLVVDTGIHAFGWSRQQVVDFMSENTALSLHEINTETDRYIGWPGQALSYKIGELKIKELRKMAEEQLGEDFDVRVFHHNILAQGTVTLPLLEQQVKTYIQKKKNSH